MQIPRSIWLGNRVTALDARAGYRGRPVWCRHADCCCLLNGLCMFSPQPVFRRPLTGIRRHALTCVGHRWWPIWGPRLSLAPPPRGRWKVRPFYGGCKHTGMWPAVFHGNRKANLNVRRIQKTQLRIVRMRMRWPRLCVFAGFVSYTDAEMPTSTGSGLNR